MVGIIFFDIEIYRSLAFIRISGVKYFFYILYLLDDMA